MKKLALVSILLFSLSACKKIVLDSLVFPSEKLTSYQLEDYEGEIAIPATYLIPEDKIHLFPLTSTDSNTGETFEIYCIYIGDMNTIATDTVILYTHGQGKHMDNYWSRAKLLANIGSKNNYGVLMMDYRGFGMSEGESTEQGLIDDVETCVNWLKLNGVQEQNTIYYAYSLGCVPSIHLAAYKIDFTPSKLIIESPLASAQNLAQSSTLINTNSKFLTTIEFNNAEKIKDVNIPLLWLHGREDTYIELSNGQLIYDNYNGPYKEPHIIDGSGHSEIPTVMGYENYLNILNTFILK
jgi:pimeloyl-ACP methyl ester carboxylesterase